MRDVPPDIYERVRELALGMVNATGVGDETLRASLYEQLLAYYEQQARQGRSDPFLTEIVADETMEPATAIRYYELSLEQARQFPGEPLHTKMISLAQELMEVGQVERAEAYLVDGRAEAMRCQDSLLGTKC
jgi:hypothetical protein